MTVLQDYITSCKLTGGGVNTAFPNGLPSGEPVINEVTGEFGQGNILTLVVSNSTIKNSSQTLFAVGDATQNGSNARDILAGSDVSNTSNYKHSTAQSFMGSGAALIANMQAGIAGPTDAYIDLNSMDEVYFSSVNKIDILTAGLDSEGPQLKQNRLNADVGHSGEPMMTSTVFWDTDDVSIISSNNDWFVGKGFNTIDAANGDYLISGFGNWQRYQMYWKRSSNDTTDGSLWALTTDQRDGTDYFGGREFWPDYRDMNDPDQINVIPSPEVWIPLHKHFTKSVTDSASSGMNKAWLPFFKRDSAVIDVASDGIFINDSLERVELINAVNYQTATKRVIQKQILRATSSISFECYEANFTPSDNIYAVTFNADGHFSDGKLIRAGI